MQNNGPPVNIQANDGSDALIVLMTFVPLLMMLIHSICSDQSFPGRKMIVENRYFQKRSWGALDTYSNTLESMVMLTG